MKCLGSLLLAISVNAKLWPYDTANNSTCYICNSNGSKNVSSNISVCNVIRFELNVLCVDLSRLTTDQQTADGK